MNEIKCFTILRANKCFLDEWMVEGWTERLQPGLPSLWGHLSPGEVHATRSLTFLPGAVKSALFPARPAGLKTENPAIADGPPVATSWPIRSDTAHAGARNPPGDAQSLAVRSMWAELRKFEGLATRLRYAVASL